MSFFKQKPETGFKEFSTDFYDRVYLHPTYGTESVFSGVVKNTASEADGAFANIDDAVFTRSVLSLQFEIFALAFLHNSDESLAIEQSIFTKEYLYGNDREDVWDGMDKFNAAIAHASKVGLSQTDHARLLRMRADTADKWFPVLEKAGVSVDESIGRPINRLGSELSWKKGNTRYFLMLALCQELGLGSGPAYTGPSEEAQAYLIATIQGLYNGASEAMSEVKLS